MSWIDDHESEMNEAEMANGYGENVNEIELELEINHDHYKELVNHLLKTYQDLLNNEDKIFKDDIIQNFVQVIRWTIAHELHKRINCTIENSYIIMEDIDVEEYLK